MDTLILQDKVSLGRAAAERAAAHIRAAIAEHGEARVIFASAASQFEFIEALLARADIDWSRVCAVAAALEGPITNMCPSSILRAHPDCALYIDTPAASLLRFHSKTTNL